MSYLPASAVPTSFDSSDLRAIKRASRENSPDAMKAAARQFEALFMNMMLKSMRSATPQDGLFNSNQTKLYTSMLDQELSQHFSKRGIGLADAMLRQMNNNQRPPPAELKPEATDFPALTASAATPKAVESISNAPSTQSTQSVQRTRLLAHFNQPDRWLTQALAGDSGASTLTSSVASLFETKSATSTLSSQALFAALENRMHASTQSARSQIEAYTSNTSQPTHVRNFEQKVAAHAEEASQDTGIPAKFMLGQAALESGWGRHVIKNRDGSSSHNLFGIKAGRSWKGKVVEAMTTEYRNGVAYRKNEKFRAYDSYADSFKDYARLLQNNPRYQPVLANSRDAASFAQGLQRAGYATDPKYAAKLTRIIEHSLSA